MPRPIKRGLLALAMSLALGVFGLAWWVLVAAAPRTLDTNGLRYCTGWDFENTSGQDVNGLRIRLAGIPTVTRVYTESFNPFGPPDGSSGFHGGAYDLNFSGANVDVSDQVHIGFCSDSPGLMLDSVAPPSILWTLTGTQVLTRPVFAGVAWDWSSPQHLRVRIVNTQNLSMTLLSINLLDPDVALPLEDLTADGTQAIMPVLEMLDMPFDLAPMGDSFFDVFFDLSSGAVPPDHAQRLEPNHPYILDVMLRPADDSNLGVHIFAQGLSPLEKVYFSNVRR